MNSPTKPEIAEAKLLSRTTIFTGMEPIK